jgi:hypothetical protein
MKTISIRRDLASPTSHCNPRVAAKSNSAIVEVDTPTACWCVEQQSFAELNSNCDLLILVSFVSSTES